MFGPWLVPDVSMRGVMIGLVATFVLLFIPAVLLIWLFRGGGAQAPPLADQDDKQDANGEAEERAKAEVADDRSLSETEGPSEQAAGCCSAGPDVGVGQVSSSTSSQGSTCACASAKAKAGAGGKDEAQVCCGGGGKAVVRGAEDGDEAASVLSNLPRVPLQILVGSTTGTAKKFADELKAEAFAMNISGFHFDVTVSDMSDYDYVENLEHETLLIIVCSTYTDGAPPETAAGFYSYLEDASKDFRFGGAALAKVRFAIMGLGSSIYDDGMFCKPALDMQRFLTKLGATCVHRTGMGDDTEDLKVQFEAWKAGLWPAMCEQYAMIAGVSDKLEKERAASCGSCAAPQTSDAVYKVQRSWEDIERESGSASKAKANVKPIKPVVRKLNGTKPTVAAPPAEAAGGSGSEDDDDDESVEYDIEDRINDQLLKDAEEWDSEAEEQVEAFGRPTDAPTTTAKGSARSKKRRSASASTIPTVSPSPSPSSGSPSSTSSSSMSSRGLKNASSSSLVDLEDLGSMVQRPVQSSTEQAVAEATAPREMVTPMQRKSLVKEGYKLIGSHSAVKLCRWTKHQLRGRGGCYKHTFYGITSYQCMEMTPSLACANKCVFCWRHHKNPVGKEWRWVVDNPLMIVQEGVERHQQMIKEFKGVPGVKMDRWEQAFTVRHCALSLVGEPIMYPHINELVSELHRRRISTFLVTNAQFPEKIAALAPVTQLYVSIDAATKDTLKAIDRPLFKDFWERFISSLQQLRLKGQRTVYRMTLVKDWNMKEIDDYVELINIGEPDLIEIKGVTFCGKSDASNLRMDNVPWHYEVRKFAEAVAERTNGKYHFMAEHAHSCCTLLAQDKFRVDGKWHTWIDYDKYHELVQKYEQDGTEFVSTDYMAETPAWALKGAKEEGFDPADIRYRRKKGGAVEEIPYIASESGCG